MLAAENCGIYIKYKAPLNIDYLHTLVKIWNRVGMKGTRSEESCWGEGGSCWKAWRSFYHIFKKHEADMSTFVKSGWYMFVLFSVLFCVFDTSKREGLFRYPETISEPQPPWATCWSQCSGIPLLLFKLGSANCVSPSSFLKMQIPSPTQILRFRTCHLSHSKKYLCTLKSEQAHEIALLPPCLSIHCPYYLANSWISAWIYFKNCLFHNFFEPLSSSGVIYIHVLFSKRTFLAALLSSANWTVNSSSILKYSFGAVVLRRYVACGIGSMTVLWMD